MRLPRRLLSASAATALAGALLTVTSTSTPVSAASFNYGEALQKSFLFYEAQESGHLPASNRVTWRADSTVDDGKSAGVDLSGGFYDAGDHVKFGFPMAAMTTTLAWGGVDYRASYERSGQLPYLLNTLRQANDYFINAHPEPNVLYVQVGDGGEDHSYWGAPETVEAKGHKRPVYKITASCPGTDVAAETAAAMAASSIVFRPTDPSYADTLLTHAKQLFTFADTTKGTDGRDTAYVNCVSAAQGFYNSTGEGGQVEGATKMYWDELAWASVWLYRATGTDGYLDRAREFYPKMGTQEDPGGNGQQVPVFNFGFGWNDKQYAVYEQMAELTGEQRYKDDVQRYLDYWTVGYKGKKGTITPGGLAYIFYWASLRMAANTAFIALRYADFLGSGDPLYARYHDFGKRQIDYALGDNPRHASYMIGFGTNPPRNPHHRGAHGSWTNAGPDGEPAVSRHILYGALVGGPDANDAYADDRGDYVKNEVALDFNSGITSALAVLYGQYGGSPLATLPRETPDGPEFYLEPTITHSSRETAAKTYIINKSAWPATVLDKAKFRYYFTLDGSTTASQVTVSTSYTQCKQPTGPHLLEGRTYYAEVDCTGTLIFPGGQSEYRREVQLRISVADGATWDPSNDWSAEGADHMTLYDNDGRLIWGTPPGAEPSPSPSPSPSASPSSSPSPADTTPPSAPTDLRVCGWDFVDAVPMCWTASTDDTGVVGYDVYMKQGDEFIKIGSTTTTLFIAERLVAGTSYTFYVVARDAAGNTSQPSATLTATAQSGLPTASPSPSPSAGTGCAVTYATNDWGGGFTATVTIANTGTTPINGWTLAFAFPGDQKITPPGWSATWTQTGANVTAANLDWNKVIDPGQSVQIGFNGTYTGSNTKPTVFTLNGTTCS